MAGQTVIDQLIVKLGLDPRDFDKGTKQAAAAFVNTEQQVKKSGAGISRQVTMMAAKFLTLTAIIATIKKGVGIIDDVAGRTRRLGIDAENFNLAASKMRNFENAVEMAGGDAEAARKSIGGLNQSLFDLAYNGAMSDSLVMLARLGVNFQTATGEARDFQSVALDTADAIEKAQKQGMTRANAFQFLQQAGFDPGTAQLLLAGRSNAEAALKQQEQRRQVSAGDISKATDINKARIGRDQSLEGAAIAGMDFAGGLQESVNKFIDRLASPGGASEALKELTDKAHGLGDAFFHMIASSYSKGRGAYESTIQRAAARNGIPAEILAGVLKTESNFNPAAVNADSGARGIAQLLPKYFPNAGRNPDDDIRTAAEHLKNLEKQAGGNWDLALQMYNAGATRVNDSMKPGGKALTPETLDYPGKVMDYATAATPTPGAQGATYNKTDVQIDNITVNTRATDAETLAADMDGSVKRKLMAAHSEQGMQ